MTLNTRNVILLAGSNDVLASDDQLPAAWSLLLAAGREPLAQRQAAGQAVPQDVAVIGYDDMPIATYSDPPLTTIHQPVDLAGNEIVDALQSLLRGERAAPRTLPVHLVVRDSAPA